MKLTYLPIGDQKYTDRADDYARFILKKQLLDESLWRRFVEVFRTREDAADHGWRGEYFGKMMRGACLTYRYAPDDRLYALMERTVRDLLSTADDAGRIATYPPEHELVGWDVWCRKYVLVGCLYFYDICRDDALKAEILAAMDRHLTALEAKVGDGKTSITDTSEWYGGMNASSILEPVVEMYKLTKDPRHLAFADHIIRAGGCKAGSVIEAVKAGVRPADFPTTKAYETMSFFEGLLAYYEATGEEKYLELVERFADLVEEHEVTVVGSAGCRNEHFNESYDAEIEKYPDKYVMQETCVTVTWMRLNERLLRATGWVKYADRIELSALNALYGAVNLYGERQYGKEEKAWLDGLPFDSYSPLVGARRGVGIGGYKKFAEGGFYGCCACIGAAGTALYPLASAMASEDGLTFLFYHAGTVRFSAGGTPVLIEITGDITEGEVKMILRPERPCEFTLRLRIPRGVGFSAPTVCGETILPEDGFVTVRRTWSDGDEITLPVHPVLSCSERKGRIAVSYGPFVLARDTGKESLFAPRRFVPDESLDYHLLRPAEGERLRIEVTLRGKKYLFTDYASCGKHWTRRRSRVTVWQKGK